MLYIYIYICPNLFKPETKVATDNKPDPVNLKTEEKNIGADV